MHTSATKRMNGVVSRLEQHVREHQLQWGPKWLHTHILLFSQLHRTSVTQGFLARIICVVRRLHEVLFSVNAPITRVYCLGIKFLIAHKHIGYTRELFPNNLCNRFGPHSRSKQQKSVLLIFEVYGQEPLQNRNKHVWVREITWNGWLVSSEGKHFPEDFPNNRGLAQGQWK